MTYLDSTTSPSDSFTTTPQKFIFSTFDFFLFFFLTGLVCILSNTNQSLWIDEGTTAWFASHPTLSELFDTLKNYKGSESQMPLYLLYIWGWSKIFGISEFSLRFANAPFFYLFTFSILWGSRLLFRDKWLWVLAALHPFVWYYNNEARPYIAVIAFSSVSLLSLIYSVTEHSFYKKIMPWFCLINLLLLSGFIMLGIFLFPCFILAIFLYKPNHESWKDTLQNWWKPLIVTFPFFLMLGGWYLFTILKGAGGAKEIPDFRNLFFSMYEFMGFIGLGPPRNLIRSAPSLSAFLQPPYILPFFIGLLSWTSFLLATTISLFYNNFSKLLARLTIILISGITIFFITAILFHFRFWGRHLALFFPLFLILVIGILSARNEKRAWINNLLCAMALLFLFIWTLSSLRMVLINDYQKDDYRSAVRQAIEASGPNGTILWAAYHLAGSYYGLSFDNTAIPRVYWPTSSPLCIDASNLKEAQVDYLITNSKQPIIVALSKTDLFDRFNALQKVTHQKGLLLSTPNAFKVYKIP